MNTIKLKNLFMAAVLIGMASSCNKVADILEDQQISEDHAIAEQGADDIKDITDQSDISMNLGDLKMADAGSILSDSVIITRDSVNNKVTIDFGTGYTGKNGRVYKGKIIKSFNGKRYFETGYLATVTFDNFYINENKVEGTKSIENKGLDANQKMYWTITSDLNIIKSDKKSILWKSTRTRTQTQGSNTKLWGDDVYEITGSGNGTASNGVTFDVNITSPLVRKMACRFLVSGVIEYVKTGKNTKTKTLDYGNGDCDATAVLTVDGQTKTIILGK